MATVPSPDQRADPRKVIADQETTRLQSLIALRHQRMTTDPFAFLRGAAAIMAGDLATQPHSGIMAQLCGDAHVANFGMFASPERRLVFDLNDFDETLPGPFEWDVKRLAASVAVAARAGGHTKKAARRAASAAAETYRTSMHRLADMRTLDVWFAHLNFDDLMATIRKSSLSKQAARAGAKSRTRGGDSAVAKLTHVVDGRRRFLADPPLLVPVPEKERGQVIDDLSRIYADYLVTLPPDRVALLVRYSFVDVAHKVVGVGSVGTRAVVLLLESGDGEPLILQLKQAGQSVLEPHLQPSRFSPAGKRVVVGQRVLQATSDPFLGWCSSGGKDPVDFYVRQLRDMKGSIETAGMSPKELTSFARVCGGVLARAHARGGDASEIAGYLGKDDSFEVAISQFAMAYVDINLHDFIAVVGMSTTRS